MQRETDVRSLSSASVPASASGERERREKREERRRETRGSRRCTLTATDGDSSHGFVRSQEQTPLFPLLSPRQISKRCALLSAAPSKLPVDPASDRVMLLKLMQLNARRSSFPRDLTAGERERERARDARRVPASSHWDACRSPDKRREKMRTDMKMRSMPHMPYGTHLLPSSSASSSSLASNDLLSPDLSAEMCFVRGPSSPKEETSSFVILKNRRYSCIESGERRRATRTETKKRHERRRDERSHVHDSHSLNSCCSPRRPSLFLFTRSTHTHAEFLFLRCTMSDNS